MRAEVRQVQCEQVGFTGSGSRGCHCAIIPFHLMQGPGLHPSTDNLSPSNLELGVSSQHGLTMITILT